VDERLGLTLHSACAVWEASLGCRAQPFLTHAPE
jgi:hypothetical protein